MSDPALTGMPRHRLDELTAELAALHHTRPRAGIGRPPTLAFSDQILAAILHQRLGLPAEPLAVLFNSSRPAIHRTFHKICECRCGAPGWRTTRLGAGDPA